MAAESDETPVLDLIARMTADSLEATSLDDHSLMLVRLGALAAVGAPAASYLMNLGAAEESGVDLVEVRGVLAGVAPIIGTSRVVEASANIVAALGIALEIAELAEEEDE